VSARPTSAEVPLSALLLGVGLLAACVTPSSDTDAMRRARNTALAWRWSPPFGECQALSISADARPAVGSCAGPLAEVHWLDEVPSRDEWLYLYRRFAPFRTRHGDRTLVFNGTGGQTASAAWRRALERWASLRWSDLRAGRSGAAHGRAMAYHRPITNRAGYCDILEVTEYGSAYAGVALCSGGGGEAGESAWLTDDLWEQFTPWLDAWGVHDDRAKGLYFFGSGTRRLDSGDVQMLSRWADRAIAHLRGK
jgi:hypothetical protein